MRNVFYVEKTSSIHIVAVIVAQVTKPTCVAASKDDHTTFEHFNKMTRLVALSQTDLHGLSAHFVIELHGMKS